MKIGLDVKFKVNTKVIGALRKSGVLLKDFPENVSELIFDCKDIGAYGNNEETITYIFEDGKEEKKDYYSIYETEIDDIEYVTWFNENIFEILADNLEKYFGIDDYYLEDNCNINEGGNPTSSKECNFVLETQYGNIVVSANIWCYYS